MQAEFVHTLEEKAGLDEATAERVAQVAIDFGKEHVTELSAQPAAEPLVSMASEESDVGTPAEGSVVWQRESIIATERTTTAEEEVGGASEVEAAEARFTEPTGEMGAVAEVVTWTQDETPAAEGISSGAPGETRAAEEITSEAPGETRAAEEITSEAPGEIRAAEEISREAPGDPRAAEEITRETPGEPPAAEDSDRGGLGGFFARLTGH